MRWIGVAVIVVVAAACSSKSTSPAPSEPAPAPAPPPAPAPAPISIDAPPPAADPTACASSSDCIVYCPSAANCCSSAPCGCEQAIARAQKDAVDRAFAATCTPMPRCLDVDCAYRQADSAACIDGHCVAQHGPSVAPPSVRP